MPATRTAVAETIVKPLHEVEAAIDAAITHAASLVAAMAMGRREARVAAPVGQEAFDALGDTMQALTSARRSIVVTHQALDKVREGLNVPIVAHGDESEKLPPSGVSRRLRVAA